MSKAWWSVLRDQGACVDALAFARGYPSFQTAWDACARGDWMLWWIGRTIGGVPESAERRRLVRVVCQCARLALPHVRTGEDRPRMAIETAERWANGDPAVTLTEIRAAADAAAAAYAAAYDAAAAARASTLRQCADLVRAVYPSPVESVKDEVSA